MKLAAYIEGIGLLGPGLPGWAASAAMLKGETPCLPQKTVLPPPSLLPAAERRRSGALVKLALAVGLEAIEAAGLNPADLPTVFSSSGADGDNCHVICEMLASSDRQISPTRFHNSVHNTAAGYWGIATGAMANSSVLCAFDASLGAGLLEALTQVVVDDTRTVMIACDTPYPEPLFKARPIPEAFGLALVLSPERSTHAIAEISIELTGDKADSMDGQLEALRASIPAGRGLPMLQAIAMRKDTRVVLDYLDATRLALKISCP